MLPLGQGFAVVADGPDLLPVKLFVRDDQLWAFDFLSFTVSPIEDSDIVSVFDVAPARVYPFLDVDSAGVRQALPLAANPRWIEAKDLNKIPLLRPGAISGYPVARQLMQRHRNMNPPTLRSVFASFFFAKITIQTITPAAEKQFSKVGETLLQMMLKPAGTYSYEDFKKAVEDARVGLTETRAQTAADLPRYAPLLIDMIRRGMKDRELRREAATTIGTPSGIGLAKLSFSLALLGHDCICFDGQLLNYIVKDAEQLKWFEKKTSKNNTTKLFSQEGVTVYEQLEDAFCKSNSSFYDASDPIGRARTQWTTWESVASGPSSHLPWIKIASKGQWKLPSGFKKAKEQVFAERKDPDPFAGLIKPSKR